MRECITHSFACECREAKFAEIEAENLRLRKALEKIADGPYPLFLTDGFAWTRAEAREALKDGLPRVEPFPVAD